MDVDLDAIWERFRRSLHDLALTAEDQRRFGPGGCLSCELLIDFRIGGEDFRSHFADVLTPEQSAKIDAIASAIEALEAADMECFNREVVSRPAWQRVRDGATEAVRAFGRESEIGPDAIEIHLGIWRRPPGG